MSETRGGCAALLFVLARNVLLFLQVAVTWASMAWAESSGGIGRLIAVALPAGVLGWWLQFRWIDRHSEALATRWFGERPAILHAAHVGTRLVWRYLGGFNLVWRQVVWGFVIVAPIVHSACRDR